MMAFGVLMMGSSLETWQAQSSRCTSRGHAARPSAARHPWRRHCACRGSWPEQIRWLPPTSRST
eukprot:6553853-Pyramimonas_sp.AAC.1